MTTTSLPPLIATSTARVPDRPAPDGWAIDVQGLTKRYGRRTVLEGLDLRVPTGAVAGFIGPNGAGKTTTLRMLLGLVRPTSGAGSVLGEPLERPQRYLGRVGALIESPAFYPGLSGRRNLEALAVLGGHERTRIDAGLDQVGLTGRDGDPFRAYSLGMKQRLGIAAALLPDPQLLILDEPTNGLDPAGIREMRALLRTLSGAGRTVLISSHLLIELEQVCDWLVVLDRGQLAYSGSASALTPGTTTVLLRPEHPHQVPALSGLVAAPGLDALPSGERLQLRLDQRHAGEADRVALLAALNRAAVDRGITLAEIAPVQTSLEERYQTLVDQKESS